MTPAQLFLAALRRLPETGATIGEVMTEAVAVDRAAALQLVMHDYLAALAELRAARAVSVRYDRARQADVVTLADPN